MSARLLGRVLLAVAALALCAAPAKAQFAAAGSFSGTVSNPPLVVKGHPLPLLKLQPDTLSTSGTVVTSQWSASTTLAGATGGLSLDMNTNITGGTQTITGATVLLPNQGGANASVGYSVTRSKITESIAAASNWTGNLANLQNTPTIDNAAATENGVLLNINEAPIAGSAASINATKYKPTGLKIAIAPLAGQIANIAPVFAVETFSPAAFTGSTGFNTGAASTSSTPTGWHQIIQSPTWTPGGAVTLTLQKPLLDIVNTPAATTDTVNNATIADSTPLLNLQDVPSTSASAKSIITDTKTLLNINHAPTVGAGSSYTDTATGLALVMTPGNSSAVKGATITMASNTSSSGIGLDLAWQSLAGNAANLGILRVAIDNNGTGPAGATTLAQFGVKTASYTLAGAITGLNVDVSTNVVPGANAVTGINLTIPASSSASTNGIAIASTQTNGTLINTALTGSASAGNVLSMSANTTGTYSNAGFVAQFVNGDGNTTYSNGTTSGSLVAIIRQSRISSNSTMSGACLRISDVPANPVSGGLTLSGSIINIDHTPIAGGGGIVDTTVGLIIAMTPASSAAVVGETITMGANTSATGVGFKIDASASSAALVAQQITTANSATAVGLKFVYGGTTGGTYILGPASDKFNISAGLGAGNRSLNLTTDTTNNGTVILTTAGGANLTANADGSCTTGGALATTGKITKYNNITTAGWGTPAVYASGNPTAFTNAASGTIATYTVGAADGSFIVSGNVNVTTSTTHTFTMTCAYTDEGGTGRTLTFTFSQITGTFLTAITNITGAGAYEGVPLNIRAKASTSITIQTAAGGTYTNVVYTASANIIQIQ